MRTLEKLGIANREDFFRVLRQFLKFGLVGLSNTLISLAVYYIVVFIRKDWYIAGQALGFVVSVANSFYWNKKYVFPKSEGSTASLVLKTYAAYGFTFLLSTLLLYLEVEKLGMSEMIAPVLNLCITIPLNFLINKLWTFR